jgi:hydroxymethylpyrimidine/phosphomethylpyrimidine kinase
MVIAQIDAVLGDIGADAIKIGMIGGADTANAVADRLEHVGIPIVFDPVMVATSGAKLADSATIMAFRRLLRIATVTTPNLPEAELLGGAEVIGRHGCHVVMKGGHSEDYYIVDRVLAPDGSEVTRLEGKRFDTDDTHGTGCTLASALACRLGQGYPLEKAFQDAVRFVRIAILSAPGLGSGHGPLGHSDVRDFWDEDEVVPGISLNQVTVGASDYGASVAFYRALGLRQIVDSPDNGYARFEADNGATLSIHAGEGVPGATTVYLESPRLDAWVDELAAAGLAFDQLPRDESWLWREARLRDPFGNAICLYAAGDNRRYPPWRVTVR